MFDINAPAKEFLADIIKDFSRKVRDDSPPEIDIEVDLPEGKITLSIRLKE